MPRYSIGPGFLAQAASTTTVENPTFSITSGEGMRMGRSLGECGERAASEVLAFRRVACDAFSSEVAREVMCCSGASRKACWAASAVSKAL